MISNRGSKIAEDNALGHSDFRELFDRYWNPVCRMLYRLVGDWEEAQDIALEAFMQLAVNPPAEKNNLPGWLYRVSTRLGFNRIRDQKRRSKYEELAGKELSIPNRSANPEAVAESRQVQNQIRAVLAGMKPRSARMLLLRYSGLSYNEIAAALKLTPGSIGTLLARAEKEFERAYQKFQEAEDGNI